MLRDNTGQPPAVPSFARVVRGYTAPDKLDEILALVREKALPMARQQDGYRSMIMAVDRTSGRVLVSTTFDSAENRDASEANAKAVRQQAEMLTGHPAEVELFEVAVAEIRQPAATA